MNTLFKNLNNLPLLKKLVETKDTNYYIHTNLKNIDLNENTISIVMTSHNRSKQVYYTLKSITNSNFKNVQVVIVDDSDIDKIDIEILKKFPFYIDFVQVIREKKFWHNPCVNYNIGFKYIQGQKVVIQNSEVCHVGDVLSFINQNLQENNYLVFDVKTSKNFNTNEQIYKYNNLDIKVFEDLNITDMWYQNSIFNNRCLHFLTSCTTKDLIKFNGFSLDYSFGASYDDNDLILRIKSKNINIINVSHSISYAGGLHLYHELANLSWDKEDKAELNVSLFKAKENYFKECNLYIEISDSKNFLDSYNILNSLTN